MFLLISPQVEEGQLLLKAADYLIIAAYFLLILVVGALTGRKQEKEDFFKHLFPPGFALR